MTEKERRDIFRKMVIFKLTEIGIILMALMDFFLLNKNVVKQAKKSLSDLLDVEGKLVERLKEDDN